MTERAEGTAGGRLVVRTPNHLGELVLALPALERLARAERDNGRPRPLLAVPGWLEPLTGLADLPCDTVAIVDRRNVRAAARSIRTAAGDGPLRGLTLTPSFRSALLLRLAGARRVRGTDTGGRRLLLTEAIDRGPLLAGHRVNEFLVLAGFKPEEPPPPPELRRRDAARAAWRASGAAPLLAGAGAGAVAGAAGSGTAASDGPATVGLVPGSNGPARRWPVDRFAETARRLTRRGIDVLVFGGAEDRGMTGQVAAAGTGGRAVGTGGRAVDLGGRTSLVELAGAMLACDVIVSNDTGPMHLASAVGAPLVVLEGPGDIRQTRPLGPGVRLIGRFDLPCVPCVRNRCPRTGRGYVLADAHKECMYLIDVEEVLEAVDHSLQKEKG